MKLLRDPLLVVLLAGLGLYLLYAFVQDETSHARTILVNRDALIGFIENRSGEMDRQAASTRLGAMTPETLDLLVEEYIREQALYREALRLGLDQDDYVMRRRLVQRLEFTLSALSPEGAPLSESDLQDYFKAHQEHYREPTSITFTHVYLNPESRPATEIERQALDLLDSLNGARVEFSEALGFGDRFLYHRNYVERPIEDIASHFGQRMAETLLEEGANWQIVGDWRGPLRSEHGLHLVLVRQFSEASIPDIHQLRARLQRDVLRERQRQALDDAIARIIGDYRITLDLYP